MIILNILFSLILWMLLYLLHNKTNNAFSPVSIMSYIWMVMMYAATLLSEWAGLYKFHESGIIVCYLFLFVIVIAAILSAGPRKLYYEDCAESNIAHSDSMFTCINDDLLYYLSLFLFLIFLASTLIYFKELENYGVSIKSFVNSIRQWKTIIVNGTFNEEKAIYIGRNISAIGTLLAINRIICRKDRRIISNIVLVIYCMIWFVYPRRDILIDKLIYVIVPFLIYYKSNIKRILKLIVPIGICVFVFFSLINSALSWGTVNMKTSLAAYTFGSFNSLQKAIDVGYAENTNLLLGNTFYFVYMVLKYFSSNLTPPPIILEFYGGADTVNVYTALIAPLIDSKGDFFVFGLYIIIYGAYIGVISSLTNKLYLKNKSMSSVVLYSSVYACTIRSFYNPTFSYAEILVGVICFFIINIVFEFGKIRV